MNKPDSVQKSGFFSTTNEFEERNWIFFASDNHLLNMPGVGIKIVSIYYISEKAIIIEFKVTIITRQGQSFNHTI